MNKICDQINCDEMKSVMKIVKEVKKANKENSINNIFLNINFNCAEFLL